MTNTDYEWCPASSADATHDDQEIDLTKLGHPGGASWAYVALGFGDLAWTWGILDRWLWDDATTIEHGEAKSQIEAKVAVQQWIAAHTNDKEGTRT